MECIGNGRRDRTPVSAAYTLVLDLEPRPHVYAVKNGERRREGVVVF